MQAWYSNIMKWSYVNDLRSDLDNHVIFVRPYENYLIDPYLDITNFTILILHDQLNIVEI